MSKTSTITHINRTSSIRSGFVYQNFWGLRLCGEWLLNPNKYKWIKFETCPDEDDPSKFYLDDIVCLDSRDFYHFYQVKHRQNPKNKWTWDTLLNASTSGGTSLIKKWSGSLATRLDKTKEAFFITNGEADDDVAKYISAELVDVKKIQIDIPDLYARIVVEVGDEKYVEQIFQLLHFKFNQENLSEDELEAAIRNDFYGKLYATESGVTNLYHEIDKECRQQNTRQLDIESLRKWCEFDQPRPLEEQFDIPDDFEFFDDRTHKSILSDLQKPEGGVKVFFGKPGVGKSVYLSKLDEELIGKKLISIKHHYHISPEDYSPQERLNTERVIEAIKSQLKSNKEELGDLANKNSKNIPVGEFIATIGKKLNTDGKALVIIVDGLDHVLRYGEKEELESFLKEICVPQVGVWIVIGMQAIAKPHLPQIVLDKCPETEWVEIKGLSQDALSKLIRANNTKLHLPDDPAQFKNLVEKLFALTEGNPLHLRYSLHQLKNMSGNSLVTDYSCNDLIPYSAGIEKYYDSLWKQISDKAKELLLAMASVNFRFTEPQLIECISSTTTKPQDVTNAFNQVSHLISKNPRGQMSSYHNSFELFSRARPEMEQQKIVIKTNIKKWLENSNYEYLKWAELRIIEHELGNSNPLLAIDRAWLIDAICYPCNSDQISKQLELAARVASEKEDFGKVLQISYLHTYFLNSKDFVEEATELICEEALKRNTHIFDYIDFESLPSPVFPSIANLAESTGNTTVLEEITDILIERVRRQEYQQNSVPSTTASLLDVIPYDRAHKVERVYKYIIQFRDLNISHLLFKIYSRGLFKLAQKDKIAELLKLDLIETEKRIILTECARYGFENPTDDISLYLKLTDLPLLCLLYGVIKGVSFDLPPLPQYDVFPEKSREHDSEERTKWCNFYYDSFLMGLLYSLSGKEKQIEEWIDKSPKSWPSEATTCLLEASRAIAQGINSKKIEYKDVFKSLQDLKLLKWPEDRDTIGFQHALSDAISLIIAEIILLKESLGDTTKITLRDYEAITLIPSLFNKNDLTTLVLKLYKPFLAKDVYEKVKSENIDSLSKTINYFPDRARDYSNVSKLTQLYEEKELSLTILKQAANNLLGYGYHKDTYLFDVLHAIDFCSKSRVAKIKIDQWIQRITPLVESEGEYTDGDETNHLPYELADLLATHNSALLRKNYYHYANKEELYRAEDLFKYVVKSLSFSNDIEIGLASTAVEKDAFLQLKEMAKSNVGAQAATENIEDYLGKLNFPIDSGTSSSGIEKTQQDYSKVNPEKLLEHMSTSFENKWEWNSYLTGWMDYWVSKDDKKKIYDTVKEVNNKLSTQIISGEMLDKLYPLAYEFDNGIAFDLLCKAQSEDHGWQLYWTDKKKAETRWQFLKEKFPKRYIEFFQKSTSHHAPLSLGVEYLLLFGDTAKAEELTEASVVFAESLMADVSLSLPEWSESSVEIDELDILIQRLVWPSALVRERAATALSHLICSSGRKFEVLEKLLSWIHDQKMESTIAIGYLPIIKAFYLAKNLIDLNFIDIRRLASAAPLSSEVIERLFDEFSLLMAKAKSNLSSQAKIEIFPVGYVINPFFKKYVKTFLAPIYMSRASEIESESGKEFIKQWSYTADNIIRDTNVEVDANQMYYYGRSEHGEFLIGYSSMISEVYRSAFLRVLQEFYKSGVIPDDFYLEYAYSTLPVELSKWKIQPNRAPEWWPKFLQTTTKKEELMTDVSFDISPEDLIKSTEKGTIVGAKGAIQPSIGWTHDPMHSFSLMAFGYKVIGANLPTPEEVAKKVSHSPFLSTVPTQAKRPFNFLENEESHLPIRCEPIRIKDLEVYPIVVGERDFSISLWQYFRDYTGSFNLNPLLFPDLEVKIGDNNWEQITHDKNSVATYEDWLEGLRDRYERDLPIPHGQYLRIESYFLEKWLQTNGLRLGYVCEVTYRARKYTHEKVHELKEVKLLNVSPVILPD